MNVNRNRPPVALITGASSGIGQACAYRFAESGFDVALVGRDRERLLSTVETIHGRWPNARCVPIGVDLESEGMVAKIYNCFIESFDQIDVLVNAAGVAVNAPFEETTASDFDRTMLVNMKSLFFLTQSVWPLMTRQGFGCIVNISSLAAVSPFPGFSAYGSSKAWVELFTVALANEGKKLGIRAYSIRPGAVETPMLRELFPDFPTDQTVQPAEVADTVWGVCQNPFRFSSGQAISVSRQ